MTAILSSKIWMYIFFIVAVLMPLSFVVSLPYNINLKIGEIILASSNLVFIFISLLHPNTLQKNNTIIFIASIITLFLLIATWWGQYQPINISEVVRLLIIIWSLPLLSFVMSTLSTQKIRQLILVTAVIYSAWGIFQFVIQDDLGLSRLGETQLQVQAQGIAKFTNFDSQKIIRAYGPFPHPNILAGSLVIMVIVVLESSKRKMKPHVIIATAIIVVGIAVTFSRAAIVSLIFYFFYWLLHNHQQKNIHRLLIPLIVITLTFIPLYLSRLSDPEDRAISDRRQGIVWALKIMNKDGVSGVGIGNYPLALNYYLHTERIPHQLWQVDFVHSVPLLFIIEWGKIISVGLIVTLLIFLQRQLTHKASIINFLSFVVITSPLFLLDHYLLTHTTPLVLLIILILLKNNDRDAPHAHVLKI